MPSADPSRPLWRANFTAAPSRSGPRRVGRNAPRWASPSSAWVRQIAFRSATMSQKHDIVEIRKKSSTMANRPRLLVEERRRRILEMMSDAGRVTVADIVREFDVCDVTARTDLNALSANGLLVRSHGGALTPQEPTKDYPVSYKAILHHADKARIGRAAAELVQPGETIILDNGTTTLEVARHLKASKIQGLTVITNALNIAAELADSPGMARSE